MSSALQTGQEVGAGKKRQPPCRSSTETPVVGSELRAAESPPPQPRAHGLRREEGQGLAGYQVRRAGTFWLSRGAGGGRAQPMVGGRASSSL